MKRYIQTLITCISIVSYFGCGGDKTPTGWGQIESGTEAHLYGVHFVDAKRGWAVGTDGLVLFTEDGGSDMAGALAEKSDHPKRTQ